MASFIGPLVASKAFFSGENQNSLTNVQYVYLAVACAGAAVAVLFFFAKLPEVQEESKRETARRGSVAQDATIELGVDVDGNIIGDGPLRKQYNLFGGFVAQFCYVGAQVTTATFVSRSLRTSVSRPSTNAKHSSSITPTRTAASPLPKALRCPSNRWV